MNPAKVIVHKVDREHVFVILDFLAEGLRQPSKTTILYSQR
jgi:hypothetical protein